MNSKFQNNIQFNLKIVVVLLSILTIIGIGYVMSQARSILLPFALAVFISYVMYPIINFFEKKKIPGFLSVLLTILIGVGAVVLLVDLISGSIQSFTTEFSKYEPRITQITGQITSILNIPAGTFSGGGGTEDTIASKILENFSIGGFLSGVVNSVSSILSNLFLIALILLFMLMSRNQLNTKVTSAFTEDTSARISMVINNINTQIQKYIVAKTIISLITALLFFIILTAFGVEFTVIWGILAFVLNFIPNIGSLIATALPLFIVFIQFNNPMMVLWVGLPLIAVQQIMGNIVEPKYLGKSVNLSPLVILFSLVFWGWLWGILGMFLSVPITVMIKIILENIESTKPLSVLMGGGK